MRLVEKRHNVSNRKKVDISIQHGYSIGIEHTYGTYTITVTVTDARDDEATESISIVVSCGCG